MKRGHRDEPQSRSTDKKAGGWILHHKPPLWSPQYDKPALETIILKVRQGTHDLSLIYLCDLQPYFTPKSYNSFTAPHPLADTYESRVILAAVNPAPPPRRKSVAGRVWFFQVSTFSTSWLTEQLLGWLEGRQTDRVSAERGESKPAFRRTVTVERQLNQPQGRRKHPRPAPPTYTHPHSLPSLEPGLKVEQLGGLMY